MTQKKHQKEAAGRPLVLFFSLGLLSFLFTLFPLMLSPGAGQIAPLWLITALMMATFFRTPLRLWLPVAAACLTGSFIASADWYSLSAVQPLFSLINLLQALTGAGLLRHFLSADDPLPTLGEWLKMVAGGVIIPPVLGSGLLVLLFSPPDLSPVKAFCGWFTADALGALALLPLGLLFKPADFFSLRSLPRLAEMTVILAVTLLASWLALNYLPWPYAFIVVFLMWGATRLPRQYAFMLFFVSVLALYAVTTSEAIPLVTSNAQALDYAPLLPLLVLLLPASVITLVMHAFREERQRLSASEALFRNAMEYSAIGMALVSTEGKWLQVNQALCRFLGYSSEALQALTFQQITWPGDLKTDLQKLRQLSQGEINSYSIEKRYYTREGQLVWALLTTSAVRSGQGEPLYYIAQIEDINDLKQSVQDNRRLMDRITLATEAGGVGIWEWDLLNNVLSWDKRMFELYDLPQEASPSYRSWLHSVVKEDRPLVERFIQQVRTSHDPFRLEFRIKVREGIRHIRAFANRVLARNGETERLLGINMDMTEVKALNEALYQEKERLHITLHSIGEAVICTDIAEKITFMNPIAERLTGCSQREALGQPVNAILHVTRGKKGPVVKDLFQEDLSHPLMDEDRILHSRQGACYDIHYSLTPLTTLDGTSIGSVMVIQDITESKRMVKQLSYNASHDSLTGLANRYSFEQRLRVMLQETLAEDQQHVLVFIDLDHFKRVNDSAGHAAGDALLREISTMMLSLLRSGDILARMGGDEFALLLPHCGPDSGQHIAGLLVRHIHDYLFFWEGQQYRIGASAGLTTIVPANAREEEIFSQADMACYASKNRGRGQVTRFDAALFPSSSGKAAFPEEEAPSEQDDHLPPSASSG